MHEIHPDILAKVTAGSYHAPHDVLGAHPTDGGWVIRVLRPLATKVSVETAAGIHELTHTHNGLWQAVFAGTATPDYRVIAEYKDGLDLNSWRTDDPYRHLPTISEFDLHLISEGRHEELWKALGSHLRSAPGALGESAGVAFAVWAPNAQAVRVVGDFNNWNGSMHAMRVMGSTGVWELFIPGLGSGTKYKYEILTKHGHWITKIDPMARYAEIPPATASVVFDSNHKWQDSDWLKHRQGRDALKSPMSIYELHVGSWRKDLGYRELADELIDYLTQLQFTHVELMPIAEHPFAPSWGYQVTGYYAPTSRFGNPDDLKYLIDRLHQAGIGVFVKWLTIEASKRPVILRKVRRYPVENHADAGLMKSVDQVL